MNTEILNQTQISWKIKRMAAELWELHAEEQEVLMIGIEDGGWVLANNLAQELTRISPLIVKLIPLSLNKKQPLNDPIQLSATADGKPVIIVDDVSNSGKTLMYALKALLNEVPKSVRVAVLVDRTHKKFPIQPDVVGYRLSTTIQDNVIVTTQAGAVISAALS